MNPLLDDRNLNDTRVAVVAGSFNFNSGHCRGSYRGFIEG